MSWHPFRQPGLCGMRGTLCCLLTIALIIVIPILWVERKKFERPPQTPDNTTASFGRRLNRHKRSTKNELLTLHFTEGQDGTAQFDLCSVVSCGGNEVSYGWSIKYICETGNPHAPRSGKHTGHSLSVISSHSYNWCESWMSVILNTGRHDWGYKPRKASSGQDPLQTRMSLIKNNAESFCKPKHCNPLTLTLKRPQLSDTGVYVLGAYESGKDPLGQFIINVVKTATTTSQVQITNGTEPLVPQSVMYLTNLTYEDKVAIETGYMTEMSG